MLPGPHDVSLGPQQRCSQLGSLASRSLRITWSATHTACCFLLLLPLTGECQERKQRLQANAAAAGFSKQQLLDAAVAALAPERQGSALQARSNDERRNNRLTSRMSKLMVKLQLPFPVDNSTDKYKAALSSLRDAEVVQAQQQIEAEVSALAALRLDRKRSGSASKVTQSLIKRAERRRNRVRGLVGTISRWQQAENISSSVIVEQLPAWSEGDIKQLFTGVYPWRATGGGVLAVLAEQYRDACAEV